MSISAAQQQRIRCKQLANYPSQHLWQTDEWDSGGACGSKRRKRITQRMEKMRDLGQYTSYPCTGAADI